ncbi:metallophosphoesterase [candidate division CSSED10-310 bacterium]|uniref:Metallophosphoesterase n=1 Tax=candidate division CSSED10-310 bacterium TaxID=2855610 RepID=A0ABV6Z542_UNCC1
MMRKLLYSCAILTASLTIGLLYLALKYSNASSNMITILHYNDTHSYWYPHDRRDWGGFARLATKIKELKTEIQTQYPGRQIFVMAAGDVIEGRFYNRCGAGACDLMLMDMMGLDYWVVGNHDWLIGPYSQYFVFTKARPSFKILSCNLEYTHYDSNTDKFRDLPPEFALADFIKPYDVVSVNGTKIGVIGLSTYDYIYDPYYWPVTLTDPKTTTPDVVDTLFNTESCDFIIALSHLGLSSDHGLYGLICPGHGISVIVGGHSHTKMRDEERDNCTFGTRDVEIVQAWAHGKLLGRIDVDLNDLDDPIQDYILYQIDDTITPDSEVAAMIETMSQETSTAHNIPADDQILTMNVDLEKAKAETRLANMICDAYRWKLNTTGHPVDFTMFNAQFIGDHLERRNFLNSPDEDYAYFSSLDLYNVIPHTYDPTRKISWLLYRYEMYGWEIKALLGISLAAVFTNVSGNVQVIYDPTSIFEEDQPERGIDSFKLFNEQSGQWENIASWDRYVFAVDEGLKAALDQVSTNQALEITEIEAWQAFRDYARDVVGTIERGVNSDIDGRIRTTQPDVAVFESYISVDNDHPAVGDLVTITAQIKNWGNQVASSGIVSFYYDQTPTNFIDDPNYSQIGISQLFSDLDLAPANYTTKSFIWDTTGLNPGLYPLYVKVTSVPNEENGANNSAEAYIELH